MRFNSASITFTLLIYVVTFVLATNIFIYWDVNWHIEAAQRMLNGGTYLTNLVDDNPPAVFAFFIPFILLKKIIPIANDKLAILYILLTLLIANLSCLAVLRKKLAQEAKVSIIYLFVLIGTLLLGISILGIRENLFFALTMPYILNNILSNRSGDRGNLHTTWQLWIGLLAAIGASQVPFYLLTIFVVDLIEWLRKKSKIQSSQIMFYLAFILFTVVSFLCYPEYYQFLLELLSHFQAGLDSGERLILDNLYVRITIIISLLLIFMIYSSKKRILHLKLLSLIATTFLIYALEKKGWYYHYYPIVCYLFLAFSFYLCGLKDTSIQTNSRLIKGSITGIYTIGLLILFGTISSYYITGFKKYHNSSNTIHRLIRFSNTTNSKDNKTLFISVRVSPTYLLELYTKINIISPWANCWMLPTLVDNKQSLSDPYYYQAGKNLFFKLVKNTMNQNPKYIIYYNSEFTPYISQKNFNVIEFLKKNKQLSSQLNHYKFLKKIGKYTILERQTSCCKSQAQARNPE